MQLKINNKVVSKYNSVNVSLRFDAIASPFSFTINFDPEDSNDRQTFVPGNFNACEVSHNGQTLIVGTCIGQNFQSSAKKHLMNLGGYSKAGALEDCQNPVGYQTQFIGMSLKQIATKLCAPFGFTVNVSDSVNAEANQAYSPTKPTIEPTMTIREFLSMLCNGKNIVLSHDVSGNLLLTRANVNKEPIFAFNGSSPATHMELSFNGQPMHNNIWAVGQGNEDTDNVSQERSALVNPYVQSKTGLTTAATTSGLPAAAYETGYRPGVYIQKTGNDNTTGFTARQYLSQELKNIRLTIELDRWTLNNSLVRPDNIITVVNPDLFLYQKSRWFIESVDYRSTTSEDTATLNCVLPECYSNDEVKNIFTGTNLTVPFTSPPIHGD